jgi:3-methylcrotonyl-CoA carboxylase alpha subunit
MEMNTRLQVEHPVTEAVTGIDMVEWQFRIANGDMLPMAQEQLRLEGHAMEARLYAEEPEKGFLPSTGRLIGLEFPAGEGVRIETGVELGDEVGPFYDPMIAKIIVHAPTRQEALDRMTRALDRTVAVGPRTNLAFLANVCRSPAFQRGQVDTTFIDCNLDLLGAVASKRDSAAAAAGALRVIEREQSSPSFEQAPDEPTTPWQINDAFQLSGIRAISLPFLVDGEPVTVLANHSGRGFDVRVDGVGPAPDALTFDGPDAVHVLRNGRQSIVKRRQVDTNLEHGSDDGVLRAPMHGKILEILVTPGEKVAKGQRLAVIEAMKMEHSLVAPMAGAISEIAIHEGSQIAEGAKILVVGAIESAKSAE